MSGRRRQTLAPSLFPFLAVLVCTLGTLILLLALVAENATDAAERSARARQQAANESSDSTPPGLQRLAATTVESMIEEEQFRVQQLVALRDKQTADVEEKRDQLTHLEDHISRLQDRLNALREEVERATGEVPTNIIDRSALENLEQEIETQQSALAQLREQAKDQTPRVVIVPHKGPNGTSRRPIYIECTQYGVTIWPEGSQITTLQLGDSTPSANPLDAALRAVRYHSMQVYQDSTPPYPLLVVRPDGIESYGAARKAMQDWDDQFGYELVPADVKLAFPSADPALKTRIDLAIREAAIRQHARHAIANRTSRQYGNSLPTLSAATLDRQGRAGGFKSLRDTYSAAGGGRSPYGNRSTYASTPPGISAGAGYSAAGGTDASGSQSQSVRRLDEHLRGAAEQLRREEGAGGLAATPSVNPANLAVDPQPSLNPSQSRGGTGSLTSQSALHAKSFKQSPPLDTDSEDARLGSSSPSNEYAMSATGKSRFNAYTMPGPVGKDSLPRDAEASDRGDLDSQQDLSESAGAGDDQAGDEKSGQRSGPSGRQDPNRKPADEARPDSPQGTAPKAPDAAISQQSPSSGQSSRLAPSGVPSQAPTVPGQQGGPSQPEMGSSPSIGSNLVQRQGRDWALPLSMVGAHGNKIVRTIRVQCFADRFVLLPPAAGGATEMFGFSDGQVDRAAIQLATAVRDRVERWGAAIPGGRWQPRLDVEVMPRGDARFHQLRTLMNGSGVEVEGRPSR